MGERTFSFFVPTELPGRNEQELKARACKFAGADLKRKYTGLVESAARRALQVAWPPLRRYRASFCFECSSRRRDPDNIIGALKYLFDGLVDAGVVEGDRWTNVLEIHCVWELNPDLPGVRVTVAGE